MKTWYCKVGEIDDAKLVAARDRPEVVGLDLYMRHAVERAYEEMTGQQCGFLFSGWGAELDESERAVVEDREPDPRLMIAERVQAIRAYAQAGEPVPELSGEKWITLLAIKLGQAATHVHSEAQPWQAREGIEHLLALAAGAMDAAEQLSRSQPA